VCGSFDLRGVFWERTKAAGRSGLLMGGAGLIHPALG